MTDEQLDQIKTFARGIYEKVDQFHNKDHAELTTKYAMILAKDFPETDLKILEAACYLHDIGRANVEEGHAQESAKLAKPFLEEMGLSPEESEAILHAISVHNIKDIGTAKTIEAKLLFDADKIQQLSVFGFLRMTAFLISEQKMGMEQAVEKRWVKVQEIWNGYIQTEKAKMILAPEMEKIKALVEDFKNGLDATLPEK